MTRRLDVPGLTPPVPGTRNGWKPCHDWFVPGVPGVPGLCARARVHKRIARALSHVNSSPTRTHKEHPEHPEQPLLCLASSRSGYPEQNTRTRNTLMTRKNLRQDMPLVTEFVDAMREAFGAEPGNAAIRAGLDGQPTFWARENGHEIGTKSPTPGYPLPATENAPQRPASASQRGAQ